MSNLGIFLICLTVIILGFIVYLCKITCKHNWVKVETIRVWGESKNYPEFLKFVCQCSKCGKIKVFRS